jgi:hypothetical protein
VIKTSEPQNQTEQLEPKVQSKNSNRKSILALSVFALGLNATAAVYTLSPSDFAWPNVGGLVAELLPHEGVSGPIPIAVVAASNDVQSARQNNATALEDNGFWLQQNNALLQQNEFSLQQTNALLQQDANKLDGLRLSLTDERSDAKAISAQLSILIAKVDSLQNAMSSEMTSSISKGRARARLSGVARKRLVRPIKLEGSISIGGAPLTTTPSVAPPSLLKR